MVSLQKTLEKWSQKRKIPNLDVPIEGMESFVTEKTEILNSSAQREKVNQSVKPAKIVSMPLTKRNSFSKETNTLSPRNKKIKIIGNLKAEDLDVSGSEK